MNSFNFHDIKAEKANAISRYRRIQRITTLLRVVEVFVFLIILSRFSTQFAFSLKLSGEYFRGFSLALISPRSVFLVANAIVIVLFFKSGGFSSKNGDKIADLYEEYVEKCRKNQQTCSKIEKKASDAYRYKYGGVCRYERKIHRSRSENLQRLAHGDDRCRELTRSMTERCRKAVDCQSKAAAAAAASAVSAERCSYAEDKMSSEEFRRTVEEFIARQQRFLMEEEEFPSVVSLSES